MAEEFRTISICCLRCGSLLYKYHKWGTGGLVKCFLDGITEDRTSRQGDAAEITGRRSETWER